MEDFAVSDGAWGPGKISDHRNYGFNMSARDLARFGTALCARRQMGRPQDRAGDMGRPTARARTPSCARGRFAGRGYGYMWWTGFGGGVAPGVTLPAGMFLAFGVGAQYLFVIPAHDLVIVHTVDMARDDMAGHRQSGRSGGCSG